MIPREGVESLIHHAMGCDNTESLVIPREGVESSYPPLLSGDGVGIHVIPREGVERGTLCLGP